jgi:hypothetical protein
MQSFVKFCIKFSRGGKSSSWSRCPCSWPLPPEPPHGRAPRRYLVVAAPASLCCLSRWSAVDLVDGPAILPQNHHRDAPLPPLHCPLGRLHRPTHPPPRQDSLRPVSFAPRVAPLSTKPASIPADAGDRAEEHPLYQRDAPRKQGTGRRSIQRTGELPRGSRAAPSPLRREIREAPVPSTSSRAWTGAGRASPGLSRVRWTTRSATTEGCAGCSSVLRPLETRKAQGPGAFHRRA